jgi:hypothetical protein
MGRKPDPVKSPRLAVAAALLLLAAPAAAQEAAEPKQKSYRIFGQLTSELELNRAEDDTDPEDGDYTKFKQLASINVEWSRFSIGAQLEYLYYSDPELVDPLDLDRIRDDLEARHYYVDYQSNLFQGRLGTFFASFGRGLTLFVQKNEALKFDEPIHGARASLTFKNLDITVLGGRVAEPVLQAQYDREFEDEVVGGHVLARLPYDFYLGGSVVRAELERPLPIMVGDRLVKDDTVDVWAMEGGATGLWGVVDFAAEISELTRTEPTLDPDNPSREIDGHGRYFSATAYIGPVSILGEYKDYYDFDYRYNEPPNAGRADERYEHDDVKGPRLLVSADLFATGSRLHASYAEFNSHTSRGSSDDRQREWYAGLEQTVGPVYFELRYFDRDWADREFVERHTIGDLHVAVGRRGEIILSYDERLEESRYAGLGTTRTSLGYSLSPWGTVSLRYAWEDRSSPGGSDTETFWGAEVQALPTPKLILTVFGGSDPGGLVCAGGQCRIEPRFKGLKANVTWRF